MIRVIAILSLVLVAGCATLNMVNSAGIMQSYTQSRRLAAATEMLEKGDAAAAARELALICESSSVPGVTDEAMFRLALLSLKSAEKEGTAQAIQLLKRLKKEYPASPWTVQSLALSEHLTNDEDSRRQLRNAKSTNQSLTKEIKELNENIKKLKCLDLELEKKTR